MKKLEKNICKAHGIEGEKWLQSLPSIIKNCAQHWQLTGIQAVQNMTWNYVAKAVNNKNKAVVLKIGFDEKSIADEARALSHFCGNGVVKLIDYNTQYNVLLLPHAQPGNSLKTIYPAHIEKTMDAYVKVIKTLMHPAQSGKSKFVHVSRWLQSLDTVNSEKFPKNLLEHAISLKNKLLATSNPEYILHGDLHLDNILSNDDSWIAIDPKGAVGPIEFEVAWFDFATDEEMNYPDITKIFEKRVSLLASKMNIDSTQLKNWVFIRLALAACFMIEDGGDIEIFLKKIYTYFPKI